MSRRRTSDDIEFGSDSFLDIVANIVGILIILIVVAGIKASATPISAERLAEYLRTHVKPAAPKVEQVQVCAGLGMAEAGHDPQLLGLARRRVQLLCVVDRKVAIPVAMHDQQRRRRDPGRGIGGRERHRARSGRS